MSEILKGIKTTITVEVETNKGKKSKSWHTYNNQLGLIVKQAKDHYKWLERKYE